MKKRILCIVIIVTLLLVNLCIVNAEETPVQGALSTDNTINIDLKDYSFKSDFDTNKQKKCLKISRKDGKKINSIDANILNFYELMKDPEYEKSLICSVEKGYTPIKASYKKVESTQDSNNAIQNTSFSLFKKINIASLNFSPFDQFKTMKTSSSNSYRKGNLTLSITVSASTSVSGEYWVQSGSYWDFPHTTSVNTSDLPGEGLDFQAVGWDSKYCTKSNPSSSTAYYHDTMTDSQAGPAVAPCTPYVSTVSANQGTAWAFNEYKKVLLLQNLYIKGVYTGVGVKNTTGQRTYCSFTASYGHTWSGYTYSANFGYGAANITVSPTSSSWTTAVSCSDYFN